MKRKLSAKHILEACLVVLAAAVVAGLLTLAIWFDSTVLVNLLGVQNSYIILFFVSLIGGFSTGGSATYLALLVTLVAGGLNPWATGLVAGLSLFIGDTIMLVLAQKGRTFINGTLDARLDGFALRFKNTPWLQHSFPYIAYVYSGFTPFPHDMLILFMAAIEYSRKKALLIIFFGDITFATGVGLLTTYGITLL